MATPEEKAAARKELARRELESRGLLEDSGQPVPVEDPSLLDTIKSYATGPLEFMSGWGKGTAGLPDMPTDIANTAITAAHLTNPWDADGRVTEGELFKPLFGTREAYERANPVTPGYEGWRGTGEVIGGSTSAGAVTGSALGGPIGGAAGWVEGGRSALFSLAGEQIGKGIDYLTENPDQRYQTLGAIYGGLSPIVARPVSSIGTRAKYADARTPAIAEAARKANIPPSVALLGNPTAKTVPTPANVFKKQLAGLTKLATRNKEAIRGGAREVGETREEIGQGFQEKSSTAASGVRSKISAKQDRLTQAAGGENAWHKLDTLDDFIKTELADPKNADPQVQGQLQMIRDRYKNARRPEDPALHEQLRADREAAIAAGDDAEVARISDEIEANLSINETALREITSRLKSEINDAQSPLHKFKIEPVAKAAEDIRATAAEQGGFPRERWEATQAETAPLYTQEEMLRKRADEDIDPTAPYDVNADFNYFAGPAGDAAPARLQTVRENLPAGDEGLGGLLAAQFGLKTMPQGRLQTGPGAGDWWGGLGPEARALRTTDPATAANLETQALLTGEMPGAPNQGMISGAEQMTSNMIKAAAVHNPAMIVAHPKVTRLIGDAGRWVAGLDPAEAMTRTNKEDIASLLARSVTEAPAQAAPSMYRGPVMYPMRGDREKR